MEPSGEDMYVVRALKPGQKGKDPHPSAQQRARQPDQSRPAALLGDEGVSECRPHGGDSGAHAPCLVWMAV